MPKDVELQLKALRKKKRVTQKELAKALNVSFQTISKWENGIAMPDITYLPELSRYFDVELEVLLGMKPLKQEHTLPSYDEAEYWKDRLSCTKSWKMLFYNDDYLEFLVTKVWKITKPVSILDCACGYGYLGLKLLPLLPEGSSYTGLDITEVFLEEGRRLFAKEKYPARFVKGDIHSYEIEGKYDIVISQIFLSYLPDPGKTLLKMKHSLKKGGMLIVIDNNLALLEESCFIASAGKSIQEKLPDVRKLWEYSRDKKEMDYQMGTKLPFLFREIGMKKINARMSDRIFVYDGKDPSASKEELNKYRHVVDNFDRVKEGYAYYLSRGCNWQEAECFVNYSEKVRKTLKEPDVFVSVASCLYLVWGYFLIE